MAAGPPIFHIGFHKTATTWFQERVYPLVTNAALVPLARTRDLVILPRAFEFDVNAVRRELQRAGRRAILCHEELSGNIHSGGLNGLLGKEVAHRLYATDPDAHVVIFIRNQVEMIASAYRQYVRVGGSYGIDRYLSSNGSRPNRAPRFDFGHFDYRLLADHYIELFGRDRVSVHVFEELQLDSRAFVSSYLASHGLEVDLDMIDHRPTLPGYGDLTLRFARVANAFTREQVPDKYYLVHVPHLHQLAQRVFERLNRTNVFARRRSAHDFLGPAYVAAISDRFAESNHRLACDFGLPLAEYGYPI